MYGSHYVCTIVFFHPTLSLFFFFNDTATTEIYTLSLHDALPILRGHRVRPRARRPAGHVLQLEHPVVAEAGALEGPGDRKSTRLNSSHSQISYAVFCLKKKNRNVLLILSLN